MQKVYLKCDTCGQKMKVSRSAIGKKGACPRCGLTIRITLQNTSPFPPGQREGASRRYGGGGAAYGGYTGDAMGGMHGPSEEAKQRFAMGADLFCSGRYEEALSIFNALARLYPGNPDIESARAQCIKAQHRRSIALPGPEPDTTASAQDEKRDLKSVRTAMLDKLMDKMQRGATDAVQLQAVELLLKLLPSLEKTQEAEATASRKDETHADESPATQENKESTNRTVEENGESTRLSDREVDNERYHRSDRESVQEVDATDMGGLDFEEQTPKKAYIDDVVNAYAHIMDREREAADHEEKYSW